MTQLHELSISGQAFLSKASSDEAFRERLNQCTSKEEAIKASKSFGIDITVDELEAIETALEDMALTDDQLDEVAGGGCGLDLSGCWVNTSGW
jgi:predicted ribosomally synthesized peptide with nif11-like leader